MTATYIFSRVFERPVQVAQCSLHVFQFLERLSHRLVTAPNGALRLFGERGRVEVVDVAVAGVESLPGFDRFGEGFV